MFCGDFVHKALAEGAVGSLSFFLAAASDLGCRGEQKVLRVRAGHFGDQRGPAALTRRHCDTPRFAAPRAAETAENSTRER